MPKMRIKGVGLVEVTSRPKSIPKYGKDPITGRKTRIYREEYRFVWAYEHMTAREKKRQSKKFIQDIRKEAKKLKKFEVR